MYICCVLGFMSSVKKQKQKQQQQQQHKHKHTQTQKKTQKQKQKQKQKQTKHDIFSVLFAEIVTIAIDSP